jgi:arylsulfatase A-like enzyme
MFDPTYDGTMDGTNFIERPDVNRKMDPRDLQHILALYDGEIRFVDDHVAKILAKIDELGLRNETLVVVLSDHGDEFFEHGNKGHHRTVYEEVLRVPFVMRLPGTIPAGVVVAEPVSLVDLMPTILDLVGIDGPTGMEGRSLVPVIGGAPLERPAIYAEFFDKRGFNLQVARRTPASKIIQHFNRITHPKRGAIEHYDLASDPVEQRDVAGHDPARESAELGEMTAWLNDRWSIHAELERLAKGGQQLEISDDTLERLESLGYIGE